MSKSRKGGVLNLRDRLGQVVDGQLFEVAEGGWDVLDKKEGAPTSYERVPVPVCCDNGEMVTAVTYTVVPNRRHPDGYVKPGPDYVDIVRRGRESFGLDILQLEQAAVGETPELQLDGLFVYGTLMRKEPNFSILSEGQDLECTLLATMQGRMVDLGAFPGALRDSSKLVHGEFVRLRDIESALERINRLEGFSGYGSESLYYRILTTVDVGDGRLRDAWTYVLADSSKCYSTISSGDWRQHQGTHEIFLAALFSAHCGDRIAAITSALARRIPFSTGGDFDEVVQYLTPLVERFMDGTVSERRLAQESGIWACVP
jgi:gamma-glutamylcyclotransferase (GGCT)/AIG2-like uncharacterized protein YtfP